MLRKAHWAVILAACVVVSTLGVSWAVAGTTGKLSGKVTDDKGQPLAGVNVRIESQRVGAVSDDKGEYYIVGVLGDGTWSGRISWAMRRTWWTTSNGHARLHHRVERQDEAGSGADGGSARLSGAPAAPEGRRPTPRGSSRRTDDVSSMPTRGYQEAAAQQAGIVNFQRQIDREIPERHHAHRARRTAQRDRLLRRRLLAAGSAHRQRRRRRSTTTRSRRSWCMNGGFNAEYGRIMSGVVNVITREGTQKYSGQPRGASPTTSAASATSSSAPGSTTTTLYDGSFGGPILPGQDLGNVLLSGQRRWQGRPRAEVEFRRPAAVELAGRLDRSGARSRFRSASPMSLKVGGLWTPTTTGSEYLNTYRFNLIHSPALRGPESLAHRARSTTRSTPRPSTTLGASWF